MVRHLLLFVVAFCCVIVVRIVIGMFRNHAFLDSMRSNSANSQSARRKAEPKAGESERYFRGVLGITEIDGEQAIKAAFRSKLAKYHPDKVTHLGDEFYELASARTKEIIQAYDYLKDKHGFK